MFFKGRTGTLLFCPEGGSHRPEKQGRTENCSFFRGKKGDTAPDLCGSGGEGRDFVSWAESRDIRGRLQKTLNNNGEERSAALRRMGHSKWRQTSNYERGEESTYPPPKPKTSNNHATRHVGHWKKKKGDRFFPQGGAACAKREKKKEKVEKKKHFA